MADRLFALVEIGTPVAIVRDPVKVGLRRGRIHVEVHADEADAPDAFEEAKRLLRERGLLGRLELRKLAREASGKSGLPVDVTADGG